MFALPRLGRGGSTPATVTGPVGNSASTAPTASEPAGPAVSPEPAVATTTTGATTPRDAGAVRLALESGLGQRLLLLDRLTRSRVRADADFGRVTAAALARNGDGLSSTVGGLLGRKAAEPVANAWAGDVGNAVRYATAVGSGDAGGAAAARTAMRDSATRLAHVLAITLRGRVNEGTARTALLASVDAVTTQADAYATGDYGRAYAAERAGYGGVSPLARGVATGLAAARHLPGRVSTSELDLQSQLQALLGEHAALMNDVLRSGLEGWPDFAAAAAALNANSGSLTQAVDASLGQKVGQGFANLWATQVDATVQYARAARAADTAAKRQSLDLLKASADDLSTLLSQATRRTTRASSVTPVIESHDRLLVQQVEDYAAQDAPAAHDQFAADYVEVVALAAPLASRIVTAAAQRAPRGGAQTGAGSMARVVRSW